MTRFQFLSGVERYVCSDGPLGDRNARTSFNRAFAHCQGKKAEPKRGFDLGFTIAFCANAPDAGEVFNNVESSRRPPAGARVLFSEWRSGGALGCVFRNFTNK